ASSATSTSTTPTIQASFAKEPEFFNSLLVRRLIMTIRGVFIGVNRHTDPGIGELAGACDDARALWALFSDTIPALESRLRTVCAI
ncbi:hypothetical protein, partial [Mesorhizobium sp. M0006]|uniref:hypothetical protein n=1 Tax=Mesorhizobium sp. M0006 TaxID=2956838 RepID=UPI00333DC73F